MKKTLQPIVEPMLKSFFLSHKQQKHIKSAVGSLKDSEGILVTDDQNMASMLNDYFISVFNPSADVDLISTINNNGTGITLEITSELTLQNLEITTEEVLKSIDDMKTN